MESIRIALQNDFGENHTREGMATKILDEMYNHTDRYVQAYPGGKRAFLQSAEEFFRKGNYTHDIVDYIVPAAANAFKCNLAAFRNISGLALIIFTNCVAVVTNRTVYLKYDYFPFQPDRNHYSAIVSAPPQRYNKSSTPLVDKSSTPSPVSHPDIYSLDDFPPLSQPVSQPISSGNISDDLFDPDSQYYVAPPNDNDEETSTGSPDLTSWNDPQYTQYLISSSGSKGNEHTNRNQEEIHDTPTDSQDVPSENDPQYLQYFVIPPILEHNKSQGSENGSENSLDDRPKQIRRRRQRNHIDNFLFRKVEPEVVEKIPWEIDGNVIYKVESTEDYWLDAMHDGRWWHTVDSSRKGLNGQRKFSTCKGSFVCENDNCPKITTEGVQNTADFLRVKSGGYTCASCGYYAVRKFCGALRLMEFNCDTHIVTVMHQGFHICNPKRNHAPILSILQEKVLDPKLRRTPKELKLDLVGYYMSQGEVDKAWEVAQKMDDRSVMEKLRYANKDGFATRKPSILESYREIKRLKDKADTKDPYNIFKLNCKEINGESSFVFKTSTAKLKIAQKMDQKVRPGEHRSSLCDEFVFIDAMHSRIEGYKTLTMWTYHSGMRKVLNLAIMDCESENSETLTFFLKTFNDALRDYTKDPNYVFNPYGFLVDEHGGNFNAIVNVFGKQALAKTVTCQWHFRTCAQRQMTKINTNERETFKQMYQKLCYSYTVAEYENVTDTLDGICQRNNIHNWYTWWQERKFHIVPAFRGFGISGVNLAEIGHSKMKTRGKMWLCVASWKDYCQGLLEDMEYKGFVDNTGRTIGKGPTLLQKKQKDNLTRKSYMDSCIFSIDRGLTKAQLQAEMDSDASDLFMPNKRARHRVPQVFSSNNPSQSQPRNSVRRVNRIVSDSSDDENILPEVKKRRKSLPLAQEDQADDFADEILEKVNLVDGEKERIHIISNPLCVVFLTPKIIKCSGCDFAFTTKERRDPLDMIFRVRMYRYRPGIGKPVKNSRKTNAYFHAYDYGCLYSKSDPELRSLGRNDLYMPNDEYQQLSKEKIQRLKILNMWEVIQRNRARVNNKKHF